MDNFIKEFGVPRQHIKLGNTDDRFLLTVDKSWLKFLAEKQRLAKFPVHPKANVNDIRLENPWTRVTVQFYKKSNQKVVSLPNLFPSEQNTPPLNYSQLLNQIGNLNFKNLWEEGYNTYEEAHSKFLKPSEFTRSQTLNSLLLPYDVFLKKVIQMTFRCPVISLNIEYSSVSTEPQIEGLTNVLTALCAIETTSHIFVIFYPPPMETTLYDCITFSPAVLRNSYNKPLFLIYQLLHLVKNLHEMGVFVGNIRLQDIFMKENLWLECIPRIECNLIVQDLEFMTPTSLCEELPLQPFDLKFAYDLEQFTLREYCEMWCNGQLSNFDYLTILNNATGRRIDSSEYHHIMPWVTDFSSRNGQNWRDLTKSKYRLNKGDAHLDHMFSSASETSSAHHVSDFLSDITYYVYMARRTPKDILTQHVRPIWVPAEYPVSIQRLQEWTPDECIPEFYSDPSVFRSIHEDLADLELPTWASCPEDFIAKHREALESQQVSKRLHYWIDLNFGYKLTGKPAVKSKNVCLSLVDEHKNLCQRGIVQLFSQPHPAKRIPPPFSGKTAPRIAPCSEIKTDQKITLPKDYNPTAMLQSLESMKLFMSRTFNGQKFDESRNESKLAQNDLLFEESSESFTNQLFQENVVVSPKTQTSKSLIVPNVRSLKSLKDLIKETKDNELKIIACLIVEIFLFHKIRPQTQASSTLSFEERVKTCEKVFEENRSELPKCLHHIINIIFRSKKAVTNNGLPFPTVQQLLEPNLANFLIPFPKFYPRVYHLMKYIKSFDFNSEIIDLKHHFNCNGQDCSKYKEIDRNRVVLNRKNAKNKVQSFCMIVEPLLQPKAFEQYDSLELLLPHAIELLENEETSILAAWYLFDPIATTIGVESTRKYFLEPILRLYDCYVGHQLFIQRKENGSNSVKFSTSSSFKSRKSVKLYHHTFLVRLIVRFGLKCFLDNFIPPLVEAVGGFKEPEPHTGFHYHSQEERNRTRRSLQMCNNDESENSLTLMSPTDPSISFDAITPVATVEKPDIEDVFSFDDDASGSGSDKQVNIFVEADIKSIDSKNSEEALDYSNLRSPEKSALSDIIFGHSRISNNSMEEIASSPSAETPVIPIPTTFRKTFELTTIDCEVGSKKSIDSFDFGGRAKDKLLHKSTEKEKEDSPPLSVSASIAESNRISETSMESLIWLSHRLGPVLTAKYLSKNLLKLLTLCYVNQENLMPENLETFAEGNAKLNYFTIVDGNVFGDKSALKILECLMNVAALYGEQFILVQYLPYASEIVCLCQKKITPSLEGALISCLQLLKNLIPCLMDSTIMEHLHETFLDNILSPILNLIGTSRISLPSNFLGRNVLVRKFLDVVYMLAVRIGPEMTKEHLSPHIIQHFFIIFDKVYGNIEHIQTKDAFRISPPVNNDTGESIPDSEFEQREKSMDEIRDVFSPALAHSAYLAFLKFLGEFTMSKALINFDLILALCHEFELSKNTDSTDSKDDSKIDSPEDEDVSLNFASNTFGTNVIGNRIAVKNKSSTKDIGPMEVLDMVAWKFDHLNVNRHLRGNWLAYWRHEISKNEKDEHWNIKQIKLQTFTGHSGSIRSILGLDNENSFISASKDKTVKLWSLRSEGDGKKLSHCQFTYTAHKKSVHSLAFLESLRYIASCDSGVHLWDPFIGRPIGILDSQKLSPVTVIKSYPSPSALVVAGTAESTVKLIDSRTVDYVTEWKVTGNQGNTVRSIACSPSGKWIAVALSSGIIYLLDARMGVLLSSWRATDAEILQLVAVDDRYLVSSSLDHSLSLWDVTDSSLAGQLKEPSEPAHCLQSVGSDLIYATPANRVGVSSSFLTKSPINCTTKLRSETLKGILTSLAVLPLNRMLLTGNDSGNIVLLC